MAEFELTPWMKDITGQKFGRLTAIKPIRRDKHSNTVWLCRCDCGNKTEVATSTLGTGHTRSCGCMHGDHVRLPRGHAARNNAKNFYRHNANRRNIDWSLTDKEVFALFEMDCFYCGSPPNNRVEGGHYNGSFTYTGIDRIDSGVGYNIDNVVSCCRTCNLMKNDMSADEFAEHISKVCEVFLNVAH